MHKNGMIDTLCFINGSLNLFYVVSVYGAEISDAHVFKKHSRNHQLLNGVFRLLYLMNESFTNHGNLQKSSTYIHLQSVISAVRAETVKILRHSAYIFGYRHLVVIEDYYEILLHAGSIVETLVGEAAGKRTVSYDGYHCIVFTFYISGFRNTHARGNGC